MMHFMLGMMHFVFKMMNSSTCQYVGRQRARWSRRRSRARNVDKPGTKMTDLILNAMGFVPNNDGLYTENLDLMLKITSPMVSSRYRTGAFCLVTGHTAFG